ncbi:putative Nucleosome assembly protein [Seiridium unicorne]|uniref:Nucleosome assembly protein n=1 Tax=Seiridium unicorne TaxID=138068 RepID=A0ABR2UIE7_9PEZI
MAAEETNVTYEQLADIEREFEDVELEITRQQAVMTKALYEKRQKTVAEIPNFWPLVFEQAPQEVDAYIQPSDSAVLSSSLKSMSVSRFEAEDGSKGDPRSIAIKFEFNENEYFEDKVLEKKFWHRQSKDGHFAGLVSEPVPIRWKPKKDLTDGLLDMAISVHEQEKKRGQTGIPKIKDFTPEQKALQAKIQGTGMGGISFFALFGYRGYPVSAEENKEALAKEQEKRRLRAEGKGTDDDEDEAPELVEADDDDEEEILEIFADGEELAIAIAEDLWPSAIKYFSEFPPAPAQERCTNYLEANAQEQDGLSEMDFEELDGEIEDEEDDVDEPPAKKRKA